MVVASEVKFGLSILGVDGVGSGMRMGKGMPLVWRVIKTKQESLGVFGE